MSHSGRCNTAYILRSIQQLLLTVNVVHSSMILSTLMMQATCSSETSVLTKATWRHFPEGCIIRSHLSENLEMVLIPHQKTAIKQNKSNSVALSPQANYTD
jgi:hypothetical protein